MHEVLQGHCDPRFDKVAEALADEITRGEELGASIAVDIDGEYVVDIWGGHADRAKTVRWSENTIVNFWSCTKTLTALSALILIDRHLLDPHAPVADYWPEFAQNGKQDIEIRHLLAHTSGVSGWDMPFDVDDVYDWEKSTSLLAGQAPWWGPGTAGPGCRAAERRASALRDPAGSRGRHRIAAGPDREPYLLVLAKGRQTVRNALRDRPTDGVTTSPESSGSARCPPFSPAVTGYEDQCMSVRVHTASSRRDGVPQYQPQYR